MKLDSFHRRDRPHKSWQSHSAPAHRTSWSRNSRRWPLYRLAWSISWSFQRAAWDKEPAVPAAMGNDTWKRSFRNTVARPAQNSLPPDINALPGVVAFVWPVELPIAIEICWSPSGPLGTQL